MGFIPCIGQWAKMTIFGDHEISMCSDGAISKSIVVWILRYRAETKSGIDPQYRVVQAAHLIEQLFYFAPVTCTTQFHANFVILQPDGRRDSDGHFSIKEGIEQRSKTRCASKHANNHIGI